jgi:glyoxylase-like metal-dependent hydrolase (beta-lactamase superfamily II)
MTDELLPGIHRIEIPLPRNPLRAVNSYLIRGRDRWLMVDTGMNRPECLDAMRVALAALAVDPLGPHRPGVGASRSVLARLPPFRGRGHRP